MQGKKGRKMRRKKERCKVRKKKRHKKERHKKENRRIFLRRKGTETLIFFKPSRLRNRWFMFANLYRASIFRCDILSDTYRSCNQADHSAFTAAGFPTCRHAVHRLSILSLARWLGAAQNPIWICQALHWQYQPKFQLNTFIADIPYFDPDSYPI